MEIEFTVEIDPEKRRHECHAALAFMTAGTLALVLIGLSCPPLWLCLTGMWVPLVIVSFDRYRKMRAQELSADKIIIYNETLIYCSTGKQSFSIPISDIGRIDSVGGIKVFLKGSKNLKVLDSQFQLAKFMAQSKRQKCDLFFPWFGPLAKARLEDIVHANQSNYTIPL